MNVAASLRVLGFLVATLAFCQASLAGDPSPPPAPTGKAGFTQFVYDSVDADGKPIERKAFLWYPTDEKPVAHDYHGQTGEVAAHAPVAKGRWPAIVFSHGYLGSGDQSIFLMEAFARAGYIVAAPDHADSRLRGMGSGKRPDFGDAESWTDAKFADRRRDIQKLLDFLVDADGNRESLLFEHVDANRIGAAGHSLGGYTVLGMSGAWPSWKDDRIRATLLYSPYGAPFLKQGAVDRVAVPIMVQGGTLDIPVTPAFVPIYRKLTCPAYAVSLKAENHFGWTNLASLGRTTRQAEASGNPKWMCLYGVAFFDRYLRDVPPADGDLLSRTNDELSRYRVRNVGE